MGESNFGKARDESSPQDVTPATPEALSAEQASPSPALEKVDFGSSSDDGVKTGGLRFTPNQDGTRNYADQEPVETKDDPTPTPEENPTGEKPAEAEKTSEPVGR